MGHLQETHFYNLFFHGSTALVGLDLRWTSDRPVVETSTWRHNTRKRKTSTPARGFEPAVTRCERPQTARPSEHKYKSANSSQVMWRTLMWLLTVNCEIGFVWKMCALKTIRYGQKMLRVSKLKTCVLCCAVMLNYIRMVITLNTVIIAVSA